MSTNPLVSIIIPCYNYGHYILEAINSALNQTYSNIEIIVVNDGSTDTATQEFFASYSNPKVKLYTTQNQGLAKTRNYAISLSNADFFIPLDADDKIAPNFVEETMNQMQKDSKIGVVYTDQLFFGDENKIMPMQEFNFVDLLSQNHVSVCSLVRRKAFDQVKEHNKEGYNPNMKFGYEDWDFWVGVAELGWKFVCIHEALFMYRKTKTSMSSNTVKNHDYLINQMLENHPETFKKHHKEVILKLQKLLKDKELFANNLEKDISDNSWLVKRFIKNIK